MLVGSLTSSAFPTVLFALRFAMRSARLFLLLLSAVILGASAADEPSGVAASQNAAGTDSRGKAQDNASAGPANGDSLAEVKAGLTESGLVGDWEKHMDSFVPNLLLTFPLAARTDEFFFEDVTKDTVGQLLRGALFASAAEETSDVDFHITDPEGNSVFEKAGVPEALFHFVADKVGTYTFIISNHKWMTDKVCTFTMGAGNATVLAAEHLNSLEDQVKRVEKTLLDIQTESTYLWIRQKSHMKAVESIHTRVLAFCVLEFLILCGISGFQVFYIKGLLSDRRVL